MEKMNKLTEVQIKRLNNDLKHGITLTTVHNSRYHLIIKVNTEAVVIQSMLAENNDKGIIMNLEQLANLFDEKSTGSENDTSAEHTEVKD